MMNFSVRTNNLGLLSRFKYSLDRGPAKPEYRIVVLGDSFTGPTTATYQWVDTVQELLNAREEVRSATGGKDIKVYNLGWVAAGFSTFWHAYNISGRYFDPDMLVVNYIEHDFPRGPVHFTNDEEMVQDAIRFMDKLKAEEDEIVVTVSPVYNELLPKLTGFPRTDRMMEIAPDYNIEKIVDYLPLDFGKDEIFSWFNVPFDGHYSDRGGEHVARAMSTIIAKRLTGKKLEFYGIETKYSGEVLKDGAPRTRPIRHSLSFISNSPKTLEVIKNNIKERVMRGKVFNPLYLYSKAHLFGPRTDGLSIDHTIQILGGWNKIPYGPGPEEYVLLNVSCMATTENTELSLRNPECNHFFNIYAQ